jgi:D-alanine-D-alanine ligase
VRIGIAFDLKAEIACDGGEPDDRLEEYDTPETIAAIAAALQAAGHEPLRLGGGRAFMERLLELDRHDGIDLVFNIAEGRPSRSREAQVPAVCELLGVPYTHSDPLTLAMALDKATTKRIAASHGIATAPFCLIERLEDVSAAELPPLPVIAKPNSEGSSIGVGRASLCRDGATARERAAELLIKYRAPVLVESFLPGAEVTVAVRGEGPGAAIIGAMEVAPRSRDPHFIYGIEAKRNYREEVEYHIPPRLPAITIGGIEAAALAAHRALGCRDIARIDLRLDESARPCLLEVNPLPGLDPGRSDLPILCGRLGMSYDRLVEMIVDHAVARLSLRSAPARR